MPTIDKILSGAQLGPYASRIAVIHWEGDEHVIVVDGGRPAGQTLHQPEAIAIARWLSTGLGEIVSSGALNDFHEKNWRRMQDAFPPAHDLKALVVCVMEEVGELAGAVLGVTGEKARKAHMTRDDVLDAVADAMTYLSLVARSVGCEDLEGLLGGVFNMVSDRVGSPIKTRLGETHETTSPSTTSS